MRIEMNGNGSTDYTMSIEVVVVERNPILVLFECPSARVYGGYTLSSSACTYECGR